MVASKDEEQALPGHPLAAVRSCVRELETLNAELRKLPRQERQAAVRSMATQVKALAISVLDLQSAISVGYPQPLDNLS